MPDAVSALKGKVVDGVVTVSDLGLRGMITLRGNLADASLQDVCTTLTGQPFPVSGMAHVQGDKGLAWMSPDEVLILLPYADVAGGLEQIGVALAGQHHLAVDVSDARAVIAVTGSYAREVLAKLAPVDLHPDTFRPGMFRRTHLGQIAAAFWLEEGDRFVVITFRSVADYAFALLAQSAKDGAVGAY